MDPHPTTSARYSAQSTDFTMSRPRSPRIEGVETLALHTVMSQHLMNGAHHILHIFFGHRGEHRKTDEFVIGIFSDRVAALFGSEREAFTVIRVKMYRY